MNSELDQHQSIQTDPRVLRSRRMLIDSLAELLAEKSFETISIQEIAARATLNRATFYLHYTDKAALLQALTEHRFGKLLERRGIVFTGCDGALRGIAFGVCEYLVETVSPLNPEQLPVETSMIKVIEGLIINGLRQHEPLLGGDPALLAATVAWAMFGAAHEWLQHANRVPAEVMARRIETLVSPLFSTQVPGAEDWTME